ncbi:hypothetical protein [Geobacter sp.]|uniref:hypothetical protein n=1 Tax=Geobacter sp. TaxID=46610 RepID=UPI001ACCFEE2|nr:hypothetical protein [Geobacter sp.]CAG0958132.1 hypothetical protein ANRL3_00689 [Anaerolineae bacterium]
MRHLGLISALTFPLAVVIGCVLMHLMGRKGAYSGLASLGLASAMALLLLLAAVAGFVVGVWDIKTGNGSFLSIVGMTPGILSACIIMWFLLGNMFKTGNKHK